MTTTEDGAVLTEAIAGGEAQPQSVGLPAPTRRVVFGPLIATDVTAAVVRRLRAAIGLGLLSDGDRLPRESDLAAALGISAFSLREALGELRKQGLIVTRAGKYGGSFVTHPLDDDDLEREELLRLSSAELRDLGDWRQMLAAQAAELAALRASEFNYEQLESYARQVSAADTSQKARRAHGRFHVELASAAQSLRLTQAEFGVHEEVDWLFGLALSTPTQRELTRQSLLAISDAVRARNPTAARAEAASHSERLLSELARLRLGALAARSSNLYGPPKGSMAEEVDRFASAILHQLISLAAEIAPVLDGPTDEPETRRQVALAIVRRIADLPSHVDEISVLAEVGVIPDHRYWTEAWLRTELGPRRDATHQMDPSREDFYDYESREFIVGPRTTGRPWATGPYVDYGGADDYIITITAPVIAGGRFLAVTAVDFLVADLERLLAPWLATAAEAIVLINADGRVIVSNSAAHRAGDVLARTDDFDGTELPALRWRLLRERHDRS